MNIIQDLIPAGRPNRPGTKIIPAYVTVHDTGNPGATAKNHANFLKYNTTKSISWHFTVDDKDIIQHLPLDEEGYHAGDGRGPGNMASVGVEICEVINRAQAEKNAAELIAWLKKELNVIPVQHNQWTNKNCPRVIRSRPNGWEEFLKLIDGKEDPMEDIKIIIDGKELDGKLIDGKSYVKVTDIITALTKKVRWDANERKVFVD